MNPKKVVPIGKYQSRHARTRASNIAKLNAMLDARQGVRWRTQERSLADTVTLMDNSGMDYERIAHEAGVAVTTLYTWKFGRNVRGVRTYVHSGSWTCKHAVWVVLARNGFMPQVMSLFQHAISAPLRA